MKTKEFLKKLQNQPIYIRKIILWSIVIILGLGLFYLWFNYSAKRIKKFQKGKFKEEIGIPKLEEKLKETPKIEMPKIGEEELKELEKEMGEAQE